MQCSLETRFLSTQYNISHPSLIYKDTHIGTHTHTHTHTYIYIYMIIIYIWASLVTQTVKDLPAKQEMQVQSLGWEDPLEKEMATHSSILA